EVEQRADVEALEPLRRRDEQPRSIRRREDQRLGRGLALELARRVAEVDALDGLEPSLARQLGRAFALRERARLVHLRTAEDAPVAGGERLADRGGGTQNVHDDPDRCRRQLAGSEGNVDAHRTTLARMSTVETRYCYRHPDRETGLSCSECGRPICADC